MCHCGLARISEQVHPPRWFRVLFYTSFCLWLILQATTEYYNIKLLHTYTHLPIFKNDKEVDSAFLNVIAVGLLTALLVLSFGYAIAFQSKLMVTGSAAFLATLIILNILAVGILMSSRFSLNAGPAVGTRGQPVTIYHKNVTSNRWYAELEAWVAAVADDVKMTSSVVNNQPNEYDVPQLTVAAEAHFDYEEDFHDGEVEDEEDIEDTHLVILGAVQRGGFCCGIDSFDDYTRRRTPPPSSCRCRASEANLQPACSDEPLRLVTGHMDKVWSQGCHAVITEFLQDLLKLRDVLVATAVLQSIVMLLTMLLAHNMPDVRYDDDEESGDEESCSDGSRRKSFQW